MVRRGKVHPKPLKNPTARHGSVQHCKGLCAPRKLRQGIQSRPGIPSSPSPLAIAASKARPRPKKTKKPERDPTTPRDSFLCPAPQAIAANNHVRLEGGRPGKNKGKPKKTKERKQRSPATRRDSFLCPTPLACNHVRLEGGRPGQTKERPKKTKKTKKHRRGIHPGIPSCALPPWPSRRMTTCSRRGGRPG